jgi:hypothetical protein
MPSELRFDQLRDSNEFKKFILRSGLFSPREAIDWNRLEVFWNNRFPRIEWTSCDQPDCGQLVPVSDANRCFFHGGHPRWRMVDGRLWKRFKGARGYDIKQDTFDYKLFLLHQLERLIGDTLSANCQVIATDGNSLNLRPENLLVVSSATVTMVEAGHIRLEEAEVFDQHIADFLADRSRGGRPQFSGRYSFRDIGNLVGMSASSVRASASRGTFNPMSFAETVAFVIEKLTRKKKQ